MAALQKTGYMEVAMRHGDRWLKSRENGIRQYLRKGKGDQTELQEKLSILLEVRGQRERLGEKVGKQVNESVANLEMKQERLWKEREGLIQRKEKVETELKKVFMQILEAKRKSEQLGDVKRYGVGPHTVPEKVWGQLLEG